MEPYKGPGDRLSARALLLSVGGLLIMALSASLVMTESALAYVPHLLVLGAVLLAGGLFSGALATMHKGG